MINHLDSYGTQVLALVMLIAGRVEAWFYRDKTAVTSWLGLMKAVKVPFNADGISIPYPHLAEIRNGG
ncbi:MAG: hypothetical protein WBN04_05270 [Paracoccaceae bacterium]